MFLIGVILGQVGMVDREPTNSRSVCYKANEDARSLPGGECTRKIALILGERLMVSEQSGTWNH